MMPGIRERLLKKALSGDDIAQHELLQEYWGFVERHVRDKAAVRVDTSQLDIESVVQETLWQVSDELRNGGFTPPADELETLPAFEGWLRRVTMNRLIDARRFADAEKRGGSWHQVTGTDDVLLSSSQDVLDYLAQDSLTASRIVAVKEARNAVESALMFLKEISDEQDRKYYDAFRLCFVEGHTVQEAADALGLTTGQVGHLVRTAKEKLREHLGSLSLYLSSGS